MTRDELLQKAREWLNENCGNGATTLVPFPEDGENHHRGLLRGKPVRLSEVLAEFCLSQLSAKVEQLRSYKEWGFVGDVDDPFYMEALRIENQGFEAAHQLMPCGHSRGDYRDPQYGTSAYAGNERCVACDQIEKLRKAKESK